jgi:hypothetical protein
MPIGRIAGIMCHVADPLPCCGPLLPGRRDPRMKIAKPLLLVTTPIGMAIGLYEGWRLAGGLVLIMAALMGVIGIAAASVVITIRRERAEERRKAAADERNPPAA